MKIWSRGLGKRELVMDLSKCTITRQGDDYILTGTVVEPVNWEFRITMRPEDIPGLLSTAMSPGFMVIGFKWLGRTLKKPFRSLRGNRPCWVQSPGCGTGKLEDCLPCPAYQAPAPCWELKWAPLLQTLDAAGRDRWRNIMAERCPRCAVYAAHRDRMDGVRKIFG